MDKAQLMGAVAAITTQANQPKATHISDVVTSALNHEVQKHQASMSTGILSVLGMASGSLAQALREIHKTQPTADIMLVCAAIQYLFGSSLATAAQLIIDGKYDEALAKLGSATTGEGSNPPPSRTEGTAELSADAALAEVYDLLGLKGPETTDGGQ